MTTPTLAGFRARFPLCTSLVLADALVEAELGAAVELLSLEYWGRLWVEAVYLKTAHEATLLAQASAGASAGGGSVASERVGDVAVTYRAPNVPANAGADAGLYRTEFGQRFVALRARRKATPFVTT